MYFWLTVKTFIKLHTAKESTKKKMRRITEEAHDKQPTKIYKHQVTNKGTDVVFPNILINAPKKLRVPIKLLV